MRSNGILAFLLRRLTITGVFIFHPTIANYPKAKFPGVVVFSEIYQGLSPLISKTSHLSSSLLHVTLHFIQPFNEVHCRMNITPSHIPQ